MVGEDEMVHRVAVVAAEPVAPVVPAAAILRLAGLQVNQALVGADAEVAAAEVHHGPRLERLDPAAAVAVGTVNPVVEPPDETVDAVLLVALLEAGEQRHAQVGLAGALRV